jgi:hypothetical protein
VAPADAYGILLQAGGGAGGVRMQTMVGGATGAIASSSILHMALMLVALTVSGGRVVWHITMVADTLGGGLHA